MRDVVQSAPAWTVGAGLSGMYSAVNSLDFLGLLSAIGICIGIIATIYSMYCRYREHKATMRKMKDDN